MILLAGCFSPNYSKIPLQTSDIPYILADGDYRDVEGNVHPKQHNVWAMSQADVYDYMKYIRKLAPKPVSDIPQSATFWEKVKSLPSRMTKNTVIYILLGVIGFIFAFVLIQRARIRKLKKIMEEQQNEDELLNDSVGI